MTKSKQVWRTDHRADTKVKRDLSFDPDAVFLERLENLTRRDSRVL